MFFNKRKKNELFLDCYTYLPYVYETAKINHAVKYIPDWWKNTPKYEESENQATIKNCVALKDYFKTGIVIPSWFSLSLTIHSQDFEREESFSFDSSTNHFEEISHPKCQYSLLAGKNKINFKIKSPWLIYCKEPINFVWSHPLYNMVKMTDKNFDIMPAVVNYKYQNATNINAIITKEENDLQMIKIEPLNPLVMMHPMTERKVNLRHHLVSEEEWKQRLDLVSEFIHPFLDNRLYENRKRIIDKIDSIECPFSKRED